MAAKAATPTSRGGAIGFHVRDRFQAVVRIQRDMKARNILAPVDEKWLPLAGAELAKLEP